MRGPRVAKAASRMPTDPLRAEHDAVLSSLSTRESTRHFAHGGVSCVLFVALAGTTGKLWWDFSTTNPEYAAVFAGLSALTVFYALVRFALGARVNGRERLQLVRLRELRKTLGVDGPAPTQHQA